MNFVCYGGPADGALVAYPLQEPNGVYLIRIPQEDGTALVHAYSFANRTEGPGGVWVLQHERFIAWHGVKEG